MKSNPTISELEAILNEPNPSPVWIKPDGTVTNRDPDWSKDPAKKEIFDAIGDLSAQHLFSARVLVATYVRPNMTKGRVLLPNSAQQEDVYQGCVGLVLKKGPRAFQDDGESTFHGQNVEVGEWVVFRPGDAKRIQINNINCRIVEDTQIDMVVTDPLLITHATTDARVK